MPNDPIKHVIVLMLENRSFDQMLGSFGAAVDGVDPGKPGVNLDAAGNPYEQRPIAESSFPFDPRHEWERVKDQLAGGNGGFVRDFEEAYAGKGGPADYHGIMDYFARGQVPALHQLAENFAVCDRWFSSVPGPTWANRFFVHSGTSLGRVKMGAYDSVSNALLSLGYTQKTIYNQLDEKGISWGIYAGDFAQVGLCEQLWGKFDNFHLLTTFYSHAARDEADFPQYAFIEPRYFPPHQNDDHPPHDVKRAQELLASVYNAIRSNETLWLSSMLVVLYDEHGGFFDHVIPPPAASPDGLNVEGCDFKQLGVRVPAVFVSPWIEKGRVFGRSENEHFDHTSLLKYLGEKDGWDLQPLNERVKQASNFAPIVNLTGSPRADTPRAVIIPKQGKSLSAKISSMKTFVGNENQDGLAAFAERMGRSPPNKTRAAATQMFLATAAPASAEPDHQAAKANFQNWIAEAEIDR